MAATEYKPTISAKIPRPIYAKKPHGQLLKYRHWFGYSLLAIFIAMPFIKVNGEQFLLFDIIDRKFVVFGTVFWPQDLHIFVFGMLVFMVFIVLFTVIYGRIWCGWACPQTIFMELIFRKVEYWIEGDANQQRKLNNGPNTSDKIAKKTLKHIIFLAISFLISNLFLSYVIGVDHLYQIITDPITQHLGGLASIIIFTLMFYGVFAYVREIVCTTICPYGRLQGVLLDDQSLVVAYNYQRGEPRGHIKKKDNQHSESGDCVDCNLCVQVCPTGIDIRDGLQLECVNCTACIDACDDVMEKINKPPRLIGFYSSKQIEENTNEKNNSRIIAYSIVLALLLVVFGWLIFSRTTVGGTLLRAKGTSYQINTDGTVSNLYNLELINKSGNELPFKLESMDKNFTIKLVNSRDVLAKDETAQFSFFLISESKNIHDYKTDIKIDVVSEGKTVETLKTTFISPPTD
ncbi:cytochrome c oxidase accessory protein CcoG [Albibacterium bauzanense]|uniref:Cytochrome c oxidase accessory protein FixG n=1 Tax=Albibacterium bauzanense TaxID=653929 RepID=A0A4R1M159_9SPHI|nr:cytochrome c oxidase accessory protein CcoG [Albibacterium bauzanense]TCK85668.1 cytochrome c oxidase accessory protein FixG [Albibacterium bauzanense]